MLCLINRFHLKETLLCYLRNVVMRDYGFCFEVGILIAPKEAGEKKFAHSLFISFFEEFANAGSMSGASHAVYVLLYQ